MPWTLGVSKGEIMKRVEEALQILLLGGEFMDVRNHAEENKWGVGATQIRRYMSKAYDLIQKRAEKDKGRLLARHLMQRRTMYARAMEQNDIRAALAVAQDEAELIGLYPPKKTALTT